MARRGISPAEGSAALAAWSANAATTAQVRTAVRYTLGLLAERAPGNSVEVRVPPAGVVQVVAGPRHTRGTPPNIVEMAPDVWLALASGRTTWSQERKAGRVSASGTRADMSAYLPVAAAPGGDEIASTS